MGAGKSSDITREDALALIAFLCWRANVPEPSAVEWLARAVRGSYANPIPRKQPNGRIIVGPKVRDGLAAVIHEVAHHVCAMRQPRLTLAEHRAQFAARMRYRSRGVSHGPWFVEVLTELAQFWYGDAGLYPWHTEYKSLRAAGARKDKEE